MDNFRGSFGSADYGDDLDAYDPSEDETGHELPPASIGTDERRMQVRAYNLWASQLGDRNLPSIEDLEPEELTDFGPYSVLLDFTSGIENPGIHYLGRQLARECGADSEIEDLSDVPSRSLLSRITDHYMQIIANQAPIGFEAEFVNQRDATILYRGILLPYSSDGDTIDFIYGVINWKETADQATTDELLLEIDQAFAGDEPHADDRFAEPVTDWADGPGKDTPMPVPGDPADNADVSDDGAGLDVGAYPAPDFGSSSASFKASANANANANDDNQDADDKVIARLSSLIQPRKPVPQMDPDMFEPGDPFGTIADYGDSAAHRHDGYRPDDGQDGADDHLASQPGDISTGTGYDDAPENNGGTTPDTDFGDGGAGVVDAATAAPLPTSGAPARDIQPTAETSSAEPSSTDLSSDAGLHDCLADAREWAQKAQSSEDRTRTALYNAVGRAYDVSLAAQAAPGEFAELIEETGLAVQERAPMTPIVKLVFGADYDRTRLTEYAAVLSHAQRIGIERGALSGFLANTDGGLKAVVKAERQVRKEEAGGPAPTADCIKPALAAKLRDMPVRSFDDIAPDGEEFGMVVIRRMPDGSVAMLGEVCGDLRLTERVARKLIG